VGKKLTAKEINLINKLAKTMRLKDVSKVTGYGYNTVLKYAKGVRPKYNIGNKTRPNNPCPSCGSIRIVSNGKDNWKCQSCGRRFRKVMKQRRVGLKEHNRMIQLKKQGLSYAEVAKSLNRHRRTVIYHVQGYRNPTFL
jgi:DNA-binding CsgD family transcriptional regulator